jgi:tetrahydromethanopterin S-methyltransferase subunit F
VSAVTVGRAVVGFVLGAVLVVLMPALGLAMALVLAGVLVWARLRQEDVQALKGLASGFLFAVLAYVVLAVVFVLV